MLLLLLSKAFAAGPWTVGTGVASLYVGADGDHYRTLAHSVDGQVQRDQLGDGSSGLGFRAIFSYGLTSRLQFDVNVPWRENHVSRQDSEICTRLGADGCEATRGIGTIEASMKGVVLDEVNGAPIGLSLAAIVRYGGLTTQHRDRLTAIGDGTTDFGPQVAIGRSTALGAKGSAAGSAQLAWIYRIPNAHTYPLLEGDQSVPGSQLEGSAEFLASSNGVVSVGPVVYGHYALAGSDFVDIVLADKDRFVALRSADLVAGGKLIVTDKAYNSFSLSVTRTVVARNTVSDNTTVAIGIGLHDVLRRFDRKDGS